MIKHAKIFYALSTLHACYGICISTIELEHIFLQIDLRML